MLRDSNTEQIDTVILGAGLSGLSAAYHSNGVVYEKESEIGGTCRSLKNNGFIFDLGIHVLHTKNKYVLGLLSKDKSLKFRYQRRSAWIYSYGVLTKYPFQANTFGLPGHIVKECLVGFIETVKKYKKKNKYENYKDWIYAMFGKGVAENFYLPYSDKFWTVKAEDLTTDWVDVRVPQPRLEQVIKGALSIQKEEFGPNADFKYPRQGGIQKIASALLKDKTKVILDKEIVKLDAMKKTVYFSDQTQVSYNNLISTIPLPELFKVMDNVILSVRRAVNGLKYNSVFCINLGIKRENINPAHWIYFPESEFLPFRISFPKNFSPSTVPRKWSSIQAEVSYSKFKPLKHTDIVDKLIKDLIRAKIIQSKDKIKLIGTKDIRYAYVIYDHNRLNNLKTINKFLRGYHIYNAGRYGKWEYLWMDDAILSGKDVIGGN